MDPVTVVGGWVNVTKAEIVGWSEVVAVSVCDRVRISVDVNVGTTVLVLVRRNVQDAIVNVTVNEGENEKDSERVTVGDKVKVVLGLCETLTDGNSEKELVF